MKANSINFNEIILAVDELEEIYYDRFAYGLKYPIPANWQKSIEQYCKVIRYLKNEAEIAAFEALTIQLLNRFKVETQRIELPISQWGEKDSWVQWDIAKQLYFFLTEDQTIQSPKYRIANPLEDKPLQQEIIDRHIAWEFAFLHSQGVLVQGTEDAEITKILAGVEFKSTFDFPENYPVQISAWGLALLGKLLREL